MEIIEMFIGVLWCFIFLLHSSVSQNRKPSSQNLTNSSIPVELYSRYLDFLLAYNKQWPLRRLTLVFGAPNNTDKARDLTGQKNVELLRKVERRLLLRLHSLGVLVSSVRLPLARDLNPGSLLACGEPFQTPATVVLFPLDRKYTNFITQAAEAGCMSGSNLAWIVMPLTNSSQVIASDIGLKADTNLLVVTSSSGVGVTLHRWTGTSLTRLKDWRTGSPLNYRIAPGTMKFNFSSIQISVAVFQDPPFIYVSQSGKNPQGWLMDIWREIEEQLQFKSNFYRPFRQSGVGLFKLAAEELKQGRADVVLSAFDMTLNDDFEFSLPVTTIQYRFYLQRASTTSNWSQFIHPFTWRLWVSVIAMLIIAAAFMATAYLTGRHIGFEPPGAPIYNVKESALVIFGSLLQQGPDFSPEGLGGRIILWCSYIFGVVVYTAYSAALISKLTVRVIDPPFSTLQELVSYSNYVPLLRTDSAPHRYILGAEQGLWRDTRERIPRPVTSDNLEESVRRVAYTSGVTLIGARDRVNPLIQGHPLNCLLVQVPADVLRVHGSLLLTKNSPFKRAINQQLLLMASEGRLVRWRERALPLIEDDPCPTDTSVPKFGLAQVTLPFMLLCGGFGFSLLLLFIEFSVKRRTPAGQNKVTQGQIKVKKRRKKRLKKSHVFLH